MANKIEMEKSKREIIRQDAREEAENWFQRRLAEVKVLEEYGKMTGTQMEEIIKGHLLGDYIGDIWNPAAAVHLFFQSTSEIQSLARGKYLIEKERLSFLFRLETVNREEVTSHIPEEARERLNRLAEQVRLQKWGTPEDIQKILEEKKKITIFAKEIWGEALRAAHNQLEKAERHNAAHGFATIEDYFQDS